MKKMLVLVLVLGFLLGACSEHLIKPLTDTQEVPTQTQPAITTPVDFDVCVPGWAATCLSFAWDFVGEIWPIGFLGVVVVEKLMTPAADPPPPSQQRQPAFPSLWE
jgi:hypothetical protein